MGGVFFSYVITPPIPASILFGVLRAGDFFPQKNRSPAAEQRTRRRPVMQAQHHTRDHRGNTADLSNLSDKIQSDVSHFLPSVALAPHISISIRLRHIDDDPSRLLRWRASALLATPSHPPPPPPPTL